MTSTPSVSLSSSSSTEYLDPPKKRVHINAPGHVIEKMERLRKSSSAFVIAAAVAIVVGAVLIGLSQARYLPPETPLYGFGACVPLLLIAIGIDCYFRSIAKKHNIDLPNYYKIYQRPTKDEPCCPSWFSI